MFTHCHSQYKQYFNLTFNFTAVHLVSHQVRAPVD